MFRQSAASGRSAMSAVEELKDVCCWEYRDTPKTLSNVCYWHFSDIPPALTNVRYRGKADIDQSLLTNLGL
jgi:hypothetical protein